MGAALLGAAKGYDVFLSDRGPIEHEKKEELRALKVGFEEGQHTFEKLEKADVVVKSPGIPDNADVIDFLKGKDIPVISEIEWAYRHTTAPILAITGSNGKTTTTKLCHHLALTAGMDAVCVGNIGRSMSREVAQFAPEWWIVEMSSFQLDDIEKFRPDIGIVLNVTPDHLDRYPDFMGYARAKWKITEQQLAEDHLIVVKSQIIDQLLTEEGSQAMIRAIEPASCMDGHVVLPEGEWRYENSYLKGRHNAQNVASAITAMLMLGIDEKRIQEGLQSFVNVPHRMEEVVTWKGIKIINDSKATNVDATEKALDAFDAPIVWIAGGTDKGNDYSTLKPLVKEKVSALIAMGVENSKLLEAFDGDVEVIYNSDNLKSAIESSFACATKGSTILLSPACASFDLFKNYEDRGDRFKQAVKSYIDERE